MNRDPACTCPTVKDEVYALLHGRTLKPLCPVHDEGGAEAAAAAERRRRIDLLAGNTPPPPTDPEPPRTGDVGDLVRWHMKHQPPTGEPTPLNATAEEWEARLGYTQE